MICLVCNKPSINGLTHPGCVGKYTIDGAFAAISYKGVAKKLIYSFKYKPYLSDLKNSLVDLFYESLIQNEVFMQTIEQFNNGTMVLVPIPLHKKRLKNRGYNHAQILAEGLSERLNLKVLNVLERVKETKSQFGLNLEKRKENIAGAFSLAPNIPVSQYPSIFLVDDILTTGSTLLEAARVLKRSGARRVWALALARD